MTIPCLGEGAVKVPVGEGAGAKGAKEAKVPKAKVPVVKV